ncbi:MAG: winged helix-turn-helix transcriptional regulator [Sciscionella sp.]
MEPTTVRSVGLDRPPLTDIDDLARWFEIIQWQQGSWVPAIVLVLVYGPTRFQELGRAIRARHTDRWWSNRRSHLSNSQLSRTLQAMERDELIVRHEDHSCGHVTYQLSPLFLDFLTGTGPTRACRGLDATPRRTHGPDSPAAPPTTRRLQHDVILHHPLSRRGARVPRAREPPSGGFMGSVKLTV